MPATIKIPGVGPVKTQYAIAGGVTIVVIVGVAYMRKRNAPPEETPVETPVDTGSGLAGDLGSSYLPQSSGGTYNSGGTPYSPYGYDIYGNLIPAPVPTTNTGGVYTTNNEWVNAAETALENAGVTISVSAMALSRVLGGLTVTPAQKDIFLQATGLLGAPPQGYPQPIKLSETHNGGPSTVTATPKPVTTLHASKVYTHQVNLDWTPVAGAVGYTVYVNNKRMTTVTYSNYAVPGLKANSTYSIYVVTVGAGGKVSSKSNVITVKTHK